MTCIGEARARAGAPASQPAADRGSISNLLSNLANPDARVRETARLGLMRLKRDDLPELRRAVEKTRPLLPSQTAALRQIVREVYLGGEKYEPDPKGFLGILMDTGSTGQADFVPANGMPGVLGVIVTDCIPGFCAARGIVEGDVILGTSRPFEPFHNYEDLRLVIGGLPAGATVRLLVLRRGQVTEVTLKLDAHPKDMVSAEQAEPFRVAREKKFDAYWKREFEELVNGRAG